MPGSGRSPAAYALLPRPHELALKPLILVVSYATGRWASAGAGSPLIAIAGAGVLLEALVYQACYVVNDLLDARLDAEHPASQARRRLPPGPTARRWAAVSVAARLAAAALIAAAVPPPVRLVCVLATLSVIVAGIPYEAVRQALRRPAPVTAVGHLTPAVAVIYLLVGSGFVVRIGTGLALAGAPMRVLVVAPFFAGPFGVLYTTMAWAHQATAFVAPDWSGLDRRISRKRQLGPLLRWAGVVPLPQARPPSHPVDTRVLAPPCAFGAVWTVAGVAGAAGAVALGTSLSGVTRPWATATLGAVCVLGALATLRASQVTSPVPAAARAAITVGAAVVLVIAGDASRPLLVAIPIGAMLATAVVLRTLTHRRVVAFSAALSAS